jgi:hypothetical protein
MAGRPNMTIDPMLVFYFIAIFFLLQVPIGIAVGWWLRGITR